MSKEQSRALFYTQGKDEVLKELNSSTEGLSTAESQQRLVEYGRNELEEGEKRSLFAKFLDQFKDLMIIILLIAAVLDLCIPDRNRSTTIIIYVIAWLVIAFAVHSY